MGGGGGGAAGRLKHMFVLLLEDADQEFDNRPLPCLVIDLREALRQFGTAIRKVLVKECQQFRSDPRNRDVWQSFLR